MARGWHMVSVGFLLSSLSASPTPALSFFPSFLANSSGYGVRERTRCCRIQTMRGQPPPGESGMEKAISNQLWVGRQSARPCPESPGFLSAGSSGSHTNCGPTPASSGLQAPGLTWKGGPREAHLSHPESWGYWGPPAADCHLLTHLPADLHNSGPARRRRHLIIGARPCPGHVLFFPAGVCQGPLLKVGLAHLAT